MMSCEQFKIGGVGYSGQVFQWEDGDKRMTKEGKKWIAKYISKTMCTHSK